MELKGKKMNFLGDSITEGVGTTAPEKMYPALVKEMLGLAEARNYGISGTRIARKEGEAYSAAYTERYAQMDDDADVVFVFGGTNDYDHGNLPLGTIDDRTNDSFYGALHVLMRGLIEKYPSATIVFATPINRSAPPLTPHIPRGELIDYRNAILETALCYAIPVLDLYAVSGIAPSVEINRVKYCPDGLHPSDEGNRLIASRIVGFMRSL